MDFDSYKVQALDPNRQTKKCLFAKEGRDDLGKVAEQTMNIIISNISKEPIYEQIKSQLKKQILIGEIQEGVLLPSIRSLAKELGVSVITTKRAYDDLEAEGYIATMQGKGSYVLGRNTEQLKEQKLCEVEELLQTVIDKAQSIGVTQEQLIDMLLLLYEK